MALALARAQLLGRSGARGAQRCVAARPPRPPCPGSEEAPAERGRWRRLGAEGPPSRSGVCRPPPPPAAGSSSPNALGLSCGRCTAVEADGASSRISTSWHVLARARSRAVGEDASTSAALGVGSFVSPPHKSPPADGARVAAAAPRASPRSEPGDWGTGGGPLRRGLVDTGNPTVLRRVYARLRERARWPSASSCAKSSSARARATAS